MDGEAGWWTTCGNIGLPPLARVMGVGRQQQQNNLGIPGDGRSGMSICIVVHVMKAACKYVDFTNCIYFIVDGLLLCLQRSGLGCHISNTYMGALSYADDITLISPSVY